MQHTSIRLSILKFPIVVYFINEDVELMETSDTGNCEH